MAKYFTMEGTSTAIICAVSFIDTKQRAAIDAAAYGDFDLSLSLFRHLFLTYPQLPEGARPHKEVLHHITYAMHDFLKRNFVALFESFYKSALVILRNAKNAECDEKVLQTTCEQHQEDALSHMNTIVCVAQIDMYTSYMCSEEGDIEDDLLVSLLESLKDVQHFCNHSKAD